MINRVRDYWDDRPCNAHHSVSEDPLEYSRQVTLRKHKVEPHLAPFAEFWRWGKKCVLDLGCGIGTTAIDFARAGAHVSGVDLSGESLKIARTRWRAEGLSKFPDFFKANIEGLRLPRKYDMVFSFGVIHHTPDPASAVDTAYHALRPGGEFRMMVYNRFSWKAFWIIMTYGRGQFWKWKELIPKHSEAQTGCPITHTYTRRSVRALLEDAGFVVESIEVDHIFPYRIKDYKEYRYVKEWYWRILPSRVFRWLEKRIGWHLLVVARKPEK